MLGRRQQDCQTDGRTLSASKMSLITAYGTRNNVSVSCTRCLAIFTVKLFGVVTKEFQNDISGSETFNLSKGILLWSSRNNSSIFLPSGTDCLHFVEVSHRLMCYGWAWLSVWQSQPQNPPRPGPVSVLIVLITGTALSPARGASSCSAIRRLTTHRLLQVLSPE